MTWWVPVCRKCGRAETGFVQLAGTDAAPERDRVFGHFACRGCGARNYLPAVSYVPAKDAFEAQARDAM